MKLPLLGLALLAGLAAPAFAGEDLPYREGSTPLKGWLAGAELKGKRPGVLVVHSWMGLTDFEKSRAERLSRELGAVALAADIYGAERPADTSEAGKISGRYKADRALYRRRVLAGLEALKARPNVDPDRLAVIGYCFGGAGALEMARINAPVRGVVSFHGSLAAKEPAKKPVAPKVLVLHGAADPWEDAKAVEALRLEMARAKADCKIVLYPEAVHAFTQPEAGKDPSQGAAYDAKADKASWKEMADFLRRLFR